MAHGHIDPLSIDFAGLRTLLLVYDHGSFSAAADALHLNQSTISYSIDRLRKAFNDPLFVRQGGGIQPTGRCAEIVQSTRRMLDEYIALIEPPEFDPSAASAEVGISSNYYERVTLLPPLIKKLRKEAPGLRLDMMQSQTDGSQQLKRGDSDILLSPVKSQDGGLYARRLFNDRYVCVMDRNNPIAKHEITENIYTGATHAIVVYGGSWRSFYLRDLEARGLKLNRALSIPSPEDLSGVLLGTDLISTVPSRIAGKLHEGIVARPCPFPAPFEVEMFWSARTHESAMHKWLRRIISAIALQI